MLIVAGKVHDEILFTGTLPKSVKGEQLLAQFASCINNKMAMHANGRIMMAMWVPDQLYHVGRNLARGMRIMSLLSRFGFR